MIVLNFFYYGFTVYFRFLERIFSDFAGFFSQKKVQNFHGMTIE